MNTFVQHYKSGLDFYSGGHYDQALVSLKKALVEQPDFPDVYFLIARIYDDMERHADALSMYEKIMGLLPNDLEVLCSFGRTLLKTGDERKGEKMFRKALKLNPRDVKARTELVRLLNRQQAPAKALKVAEQGIKAMPDYAPFYCMAGDILRKQNKLNKAQDYYEQCLELDSSQESAKRGIDAVMRGLENNNEGGQRTPEQEAREEMLEAANLFSAGDFDQAILRLMDIKDIPGVEREATLLLGFAFAKKGLYKRAHDVFISYLNRHDPDIRVLYNLGKALNRMGRYDEGLAYLHDALEIDSDYEEALVEMGIACQMTGRHNEAREAFVRALKMDRDNPRPYAYLALLAHEYNDEKKMKEFLKRANASDPDCPEIALVRGAIAVRDCEYETGAEPLQACLEKEPDHFEALKMLGFIRAQTHDIEGAYDCYRAAVTLNPSDQECNQILEELSGHLNA